MHAAEECCRERHVDQSVESSCSRLCKLGDRMRRLSDLQMQLLGKFHNCIVSHAGIDQTVGRIAEYLEDAEPGLLEEWRPRLRADAAEFVAMCPTCQLTRVPGTLPYAPQRHRTHVLEPFHTVCFDHLGPVIGKKRGKKPQQLPEECEGRNHVLVCVDAMTGYTMLVPVSHCRRSTRHGPCCRSSGTTDAPGG